MKVLAMLTALCIPVATFAIGSAGAGNAGLYAAAILALQDADLAERLEDFRRAQERRVLDLRLPELS